MLRKFVCAVAILGLSIGLAIAEDIKGKITKISDTKLTFTAADPDNKGKYLDAKDYTISSDAKVSKMVKKEKVAVEGNLKAKELTDIPAKGLNATISVTDGKVSEIVLGGGKKKAAN